MGKLRNCLEAFGWQDYSCVTLAGVSGGQLREILKSVACIGMWRKTGLGTFAANPIKLCVLNSVCVNNFDGRCWKVREKRES